MTDEKKAEAQVVEADRMESGAALEAINRAEIDQQVATAKKYPRNLSTVRKQILDLATMDQDTAESCFYALPRDGKVIDGPSVRMAEIVASCYGNLRTAARIVEIGDKHIVSQGACMDLQNNVASSVEVRRRITNKYGDRYSEDMIVTTGNAASSIAFRNAVFKVVPRAFYKSLEKEIRKIGMGNERTLSERQKAAMAWAKGQGIDPKQVYALLTQQHPDRETKGPEDMTLEDLELLRGIKVAVDEGTTTLQDTFGGLGTGDSKAPKAAKKAASKAKGKKKAAALRAAAKKEEQKPDDEYNDRLAYLKEGQEIAPDAVAEALEELGVDSIEDAAADPETWLKAKAKINEKLD
jgi:hypothetical protein